MMSQLSGVAGTLSAKTQNYTTCLAQKYIMVNGVIRQSFFYITQRLRSLGHRGRFSGKVVFYTFYKKYRQ